MSLSQISPASSSLQGMTLPIPHSAPHSPPLPHSAPLSRAMTPVQLLHQQVEPGGSSTLSTSHNPWLLKTSEMSATATLPLPRRPVSEMRLGGFQGEIWSGSPAVFLDVFFPDTYSSFLILFLHLGSSLPRMMPLSGPTRVEAMFSHTPGTSDGSGGTTVGGACLLHFLPGDNIALLISEPRDGWHYGQNERTGRYGLSIFSSWFIFWGGLKTFNVTIVLKIKNKTALNKVRQGFINCLQLVACVSVNKTKQAHHVYFVHLVSQSELELLNLEMTKPFGGWKKLNGLIKQPMTTQALPALVPIVACKCWHHWILWC